LFVSTTAAQEKVSQGFDTSFTISYTHFEACELGDMPCPILQFQRNNLADSITLYVPCGGSATSVSLMRWTDETPIQTLDILWKDCPPLFDLTNLEDGKYYVLMMACGLGGTVAFKLETLN
jgi:hypothetical protein